jgi:dTDP-4-dehydrorhamnose reductase
MKILLLGANGYLGARLFFDLRDSFGVVGTYNKTQFFKDFVQLDITNEQQVIDVFKAQTPDIVIQTANYPSPRPAADNPEAYSRLNLDSTKHIVDAANEVGAKVIFISSFAALNPDNIYGELKTKSEEVIKQTKVGYLIIRPSLILGYSPNIQNDRPFNRILKCLDNKTIGQFDTSWQFQPTYIGHISEVIRTAIDKNVLNKVIHVFCPSIQTQYSTAKDILQPFGLEVKPVDKGMEIPVQERNETELTELGLPTCSYHEMISSIHEEIRNKEDYKL